MDPAKVVPAASALILAGALIFLLWGDRLGVLDLVSRVPSWAMLAIVVGAVFLQWRLNPKAFLQGWGRWALLATVAIGLAFVILSLFRG